IPNVMAAITIGLHFKVEIEGIKSAIANYSPDNSRSQLMEKGSNTIILDAYNANPSSMVAAIKNFMELDVKNKIIWIGAMKEMGADSAKEHELLIQLLQQYSWKQVIIVGPEFKQIKHDFLWFEKATQAQKYLQKEP